MLGSSTSSICWFAGLALLSAAATGYWSFTTPSAALRAPSLDLHVAPSSPDAWPSWVSAVAIREEARDILLDVGLESESLSSITTSAESAAIYRADEIEPRWRARWEADRLYETPDDSELPKWYSLTMYPYPSGILHIGHWYAFAVPDVFARFQRMRGYNVLFPMGFDAFGLPAENAAIRHNIHPAQWTFDNIEQEVGDCQNKTDDNQLPKFEPDIKGQ